MKRSSPHRQRGAAVMAVTALLCFTALLAIAYANRGLVAEERASVSLVRNAEAAQAAEAGLEWALALLNDTTRRGPDCLPVSAPGGLSFSERSLEIDAAGTGFVPLGWNDAGTQRPLAAACRRDGAGWSCSCPTNAPSGLAPLEADALSTSFTTSFSIEARPGLVRVTSSGCTRGDGACTAGAADADAAVHIEALFAWRPALRAAPAAALTVRGNVVSAAALGLAYDPAAGGLAVQAGGHVDASDLRIATADGSPTAGSVAADDPSLSSLDAARFFARYFGTSKPRWAAQPGAVHVDCSSNCGTALAAAADRGARLLFVHGGAVIDGPLSLGSNAAPIVLVVDGPLQVNGATTLVGVLEAASLEWRGSGGVRGATVVEGDYGGSGNPELARDQAVLNTLGQRAGSFARVNGSWKDF